MKYLKIKVDSFGFEGEATLCEQKTPSGLQRNNYRFDNNMVPKGPPRSFPTAGGAYQTGRGGGNSGGMNNRPLNTTGRKFLINF